MKKLRSSFLLGTLGVFLSVLTVSYTLHAQLVPTIEWEKSLGGTNYDYTNAIEQTDDGGYIMAGSSNSNDIDVSGNHGGYDYWVWNS